MKEKLKLKVQSIDANLHNYIVSYQGENVPVRQYPFQYNLKKPDTLICINTTPGLPIPSLSQDMKTVIEDIYEEDVPYHFSVNKLRRSGENVFDAELRDQYGFTYCYRNAGRKAITVLGKEIELYIHRINEDGTILFYTSKQLTDDSTHLTPTITDDEFNIFRRLSDKRRDAKKVLVDDPDYCGLWKSIIDKYPHRTHFIYELLQNADDVKATTVSFFLFKDGLVFKHNGSVPFSVTDPSIRSSNGHINSITGIGRSTKISNTIGKFGVGFKAVYVYTSRPEIHDDKFHFAIEERIVPVWLGCDHPMRSIGETLFYFPFDNPGSAYNEILEKLKSLENPHLFLNNLQEINWVTEYGEKGCFVKNTLYEFTVKNTCCQHLSIKNNDNDKNLWLFTWNTPIKNYGRHNISVGYFLNDDGIVDTEVRNPIYCFFPTNQKVDLCCIIHAPFLLTDNRQDVTFSEENKEMIEKLSWLAASAIPILRDRSFEEGTQMIGDNLFHIVPLRKNRYHPNDEIFDMDLFYKAFRDKLREEPLILSRNGKFLTRDQALIPLRKEIVNLLTVNQLNMLFTSHGETLDFISPSIDTNSSQYYLSDEIGLKTFGYQDLATKITPAFMQSQHVEWLSKFYYSILENAKQYLKTSMLHKLNPYGGQSYPAFRKAPIFRNQHGDWIQPFKGEKLDVANIFKPSTIIDPSINVVDNDLYAIDNCQKLLEYLQIGEPNAYERIKETLIKYENNEISVTTDDCKNDFELFLTYFLKASPDKQTEFVDKAKNYAFLLQIGSDGKYYRDIASSFCLKSDMMSRYLKGNVSDNIKFIDDDFYATMEKKYGVDKINSFLRSLGAHSFPPVSFPKLDFNCLSNSQKLYIWSCRGTSPEYTDAIIPGLEHAINAGNIDLEISQRLWDEISRWSTQIDKLKFKVSTMYYGKRREYLFDSSLIELLKSRPWLIIEGLHARKPLDVTIEQLLEAGYSNQKELFQYFGIIHDKTFIPSDVLTPEQLKTYQKGQLVEDLDPEDIQEMRQYLSEKKIREKQALDRAARIRQGTPTTNALGAKKEMKDNSIASLFCDNTTIPLPPRAGSGERNTTQSSDKDILDLAERLDKEKDEKLTHAKLRKSVMNMEKYSMEWFCALMELELHTTGQDDYQSSTRISISFSEVSPSSDSRRIYILKNPSGLIPMKLEEMGGLAVIFTFRDKESITKSFDVACVRNFSLLLKANQEDEDSLSHINWTECSRAEISINSISDLEKRLCTAFAQLGFPSGYNLKEHLGNNIRFVFGPPGTGKTTYLSHKITELLDAGNAKILVLTPTNKACDVLTMKLLAHSEENYSRIGRFVATAISEIEDSGILITRKSTFYQQNPCCLISTIARLPYDGFVGADGNKSLREIDWDYVIIDEASMIPIAHITYAIYKFLSSQIIIAGDPLQIAPIVQEPAWKDENIYTMTNLLTFDNPKTEPIPFRITYLDTQYRSLPEIGNLFSHYSYSGLLKNFRKPESQKPLKVEGLDFKTINYIPFRVDRYDSLYGPKKLNGSNIHIYSALLVVEFVCCIASNYSQEEDGDILNIGIICPYAPQAHIIHNLLIQRETPSFVHITVGTIHGFQGDECDVIITVFNPPTGLKGAADSVLINNRNIVNVAISRAKDYLFVFMPSSETDGFDKLYELNKLGGTTKQHCTDVSVINSDCIEAILFNQQFYIENHSFVTSHQLANIYSEAQARYEIRVDNNAVDIQIDNSR